jgi:hypothetical protein
LATGMRKQWKVFVRFRWLLFGRGHVMHLKTGVLTGVPAIFSQ